jgi:hypothetical protein
MASWKSTSLIQLCAVGTVVAVIWLNFNERTNALEKRILRLEEELAVLSPLAQVMRGFQPGRATPQAYEVVQATGPANAPTAGADSALAWCPATEDGGSEWLELRYDPPIAAAEIRIHANLNPGAVVRVLGSLDGTAAREIWAGDGSTETVKTIPVAGGGNIGWLRLELDTAKVPGWNEIDAVALVDANGTLHWAKSAKASSTWGRGSSLPNRPR